MEHKEGGAQKLLFPEVVQLSMSDAVMLENLLPEMSRLGFDLSNLGNGSFAVNGILIRLWLFGYKILIFICKKHNMSPYLRFFFSISAGVFYM